MDGGGSSFANPQKPEEEEESPYLSDITAKFVNLRIDNSHCVKKSKPCRIVSRFAKKSKPRIIVSSPAKKSKSNTSLQKPQETLLNLEQQPESPTRNQAQFLAQLNFITPRFDNLSINNSDISDESSFPFPAEFNNIVTLFDFDESWRSPWRFLRKKTAKQIKLENLKQKILRDIPRVAVITCWAFKIYLDAGIVPSDSKAKATLQAFSNNEITVKSIAEELVKDAEQEYGITLECDYDTMVFPKIPCW
ncbi:uncharacterized protein LOC130724638 [Lotus japonicus]|uniref:uncharacterized protein LOC130724638 n=1 Tax=Lotus japonicus TaxID=34305 RepID=UPI00258261AE|nr:uncharacterized protein LOC130724638 [Lotus japonicus]